MGISYYFMNKANKQVGPLSLDELKQRGITRETPVWREGMPNWVQAKNIPELHAYIVTPSPYINVVRLVLAPSYSYSRVNLFLHLSPPVLTSTLMFRDLSPSSSGYWASPSSCFIKKENTC